ncbi:MAG: polysaccharide deacetylase family protein [Eubacteriales bacterium]|nr:polysaccharide deacetylase family protein [Eubacteriales bacterium]
MSQEFEQKPEHAQDKRKKAKENLEALQKLIEELDLVDEPSEAAVGEQEKAQPAEPEQPIEKAEQEEAVPASDKPEEPAPSVDELIERAAAASEEQEPEEPQEQQQAPQPRKQQPKRAPQPEPAKTKARPAKPSGQAAAQKPATRKTIRRKKNSKAAVLRRRRRRLTVLVAGVVIALVLIVLLVSAVRALSNRNKDQNIEAGSAVVLTEEEQRAARQKEGPASEQITKQYRAIKNDTSLPSYAHEYPGLYADAVAKENKESKKKVCYLTFDDGPSENNTPEILDLLAKEGVKATFFVVGSEINEDTEDIIQRIVKEGHTLCIHANEHVYDELYASTEAYLADFAEAYDKIYELTGYRVQGFRFPGGSNGRLKKSGYYDAIVAEMTRRGFEYYDWNAYSHDAEPGDYTADDLVENALHEIEISSRNDVFLLMHDAYDKEKTVEALKGIIDGLNEEGIQMLPVTNATRPVHFEVDETTPSEYGGASDTDEDADTSAEKPQY